jgi:ABC-type Na+ efflux pump permease subunit
MQEWIELRIIGKAPGAGNVATALPWAAQWVFSAAGDSFRGSVMLASIFITIFFGLLGILGLLIAAGSPHDPAQYMGLGLLILSWFLVVGYHANRAEKAGKAQHSH